MTNVMRSVSVIGLTLLLCAATAPAALVIGSNNNNYALNDTNSDDLGNSVFATGSGSVAVGEQNNTPPTTNELRYWLPFTLTSSDRAAIASASQVLLDVSLLAKQNVSGFEIDLVGLANRTSDSAVSSDYQASGSMLADGVFTATASLGRYHIDVTSFVKTQAALPDSVVVFRFQADPESLLPDGNLERNNYIVATHQHSTSSSRPTLTVVPEPAGLVPLLMLGSLIRRRR